MSKPLTEDQAVEMLLRRYGLTGESESLHDDRFGNTRLFHGPNAELLAAMDRGRRASRGGAP